MSEVLKFGIGQDNVFEMWDWVGGRFSVDSAIGLSLMVAIGHTSFEEMCVVFVRSTNIPDHPVRSESAGVVRVTGNLEQQLPRCGYAGSVAV